MNRKLILLIAATMLLCACRDDVLYQYYSYGGDTVTRINDGVDANFYKGMYRKGDKLPSSYIHTEYSGIDGGMEGYLKFDNLHNILVLRVYDDFKKIGSDSSLILIDYIENSKFIKWHNSIQGHYKNVAHIFDYEDKGKREKEDNSRNKSEVCRFDQHR